jgi:nucleoside-diphosphate-sugar epimerase
VSTGFVYREQGRPLREDDPIDTLHPYGASKAAADTLLRAAAHRLQRHLTVVRPFSFTGVHDGGDRLFPSLLRCAIEGRSFSMSSGKQVRDFCAVQDVADAIYRILDRVVTPRVDVFNIGSGSRLPLRDLVEDVIAHLEIDVQVNFGRTSPRSPEPMHLVADVRRIQNELGWRAKTSVVQAVWELATTLYPALPVRKPMEAKWQIRAASI